MYAFFLSYYSIMGRIIKKRNDKHLLTNLQEQSMTRARKPNECLQIQCAEKCKVFWQL